MIRAGLAVIDVAIRIPSDLTPEVMVEWSKAEIGSRIVVTGTEATSLEDLMADLGSYGALSAIETVNAVRPKIQSIRSMRLHLEGRKDESEYRTVHVSFSKTIFEAMATLEEDMPLAWIHLGHGDDGSELGDNIEVLSNGAEAEDWKSTEKISRMISEGVGSMLFCILPVCYSSQSGDVLQDNPNILAIHAAERAKCHDFSKQFIQMPKWIEIPEWRAASQKSFRFAGTEIMEEHKSVSGLRN